MRLDRGWDVDRLPIAIGQVHWNISWKKGGILIQYCIQLPIAAKVDFAP